MYLLCQEPVSPNDSDARKVSTLSVQETFKNACASKEFDIWALEVLGLLESCNDLPAVDAVYHKKCHTRFVIGRAKIQGESSVGRPVKCDADIAFLKLCDALETCCVQKVYTVTQLHDEMVSLASPGCDVYDVKWLKAKLQDRYGSDLFIGGESGRPGVVCFRKFTTHLLGDEFYEHRDGNSLSKGEEVIKQAARYIAAELRSMPCNMEHYPNPDDIENSAVVVPHLLDLFLSQLVTDERKKTAIAQVLIQSARPRSCLMPLPFGLGVQVHRLLGSAQLVKELARWGFSVSLDEVQRYLQSVLQSTNGWQPEECREAMFTQFVADNVDHNIKTVDGLETFHGMGIIAVSCFGRGVELVAKRKIKRIPGRLLVADACRDKGLSLIPYCSQIGLGLAKLMFKPIASLNLPMVACSAASLTMLWHVGGLNSVSSGPRPMWSGYMQSVCQGDHPPTSVVRMLPILDINPSDMSCIYSTLTFVCKQAELLNVKTPSITFDQPLFIKAVDIVAQEQLDMVVRLGGFHTLMNFMGALGHIMQGSGLEDAFELLYGKKTVAHVMSGKAYVRAVRGHMIVHSAVKSLLLSRLMPAEAHCDVEMSETVVTECSLQHLCLDESDIHSLQLLYRAVSDRKALLTSSIDHSEVLQACVSADEITTHESLSKLMCSYDELCSILSEQSRTARLWILYLKYVEVLQQFLIAERTSNWTLHLNTLRRMLGLFAAAHHVNYAKSARLYWQQMCDLPTTHPWLH